MVRRSVVGRRRFRRRKYRRGGLANYKLLSNRFFNKYPSLVRTSPSRLIYTYADKQVFSITKTNLSPTNFFTLFNPFQQIQDMGFSTPSNFSFLRPPDYCYGEVMATASRYRFWRIKHMKTYIKNLVITSTISAQASSAQNGKSKIGVVYHYDPASMPKNDVEDVYVHWHVLPLRKSIPMSWHSCQKGWFDQTYEAAIVVPHDASKTIPGTVNTSQKFSEIAGISAMSWQESGNVGDNKRSLNVAIPTINAFWANMPLQDALMFTTLHNPMIMNTRMVKPYFILQPDFHFSTTDTLEFRYTVYQYVTLEFKENTEMWYAHTGRNKENVMNENINMMNDIELIN